MEIQPKISDSAGTGSSGLPQTNDRSVSTTVRIKDGQTIVIAGLIQSVNHESVNKVPILGDLPLIGSLFTSTDTVQS